MAGGGGLDGEVSTDGSNDPCPRELSQDSTGCCPVEVVGPRARTGKERERKQVRGYDGTSPLAGAWLQRLRGGEGPLQRLWERR